MGRAKVTLTLGDPLKGRDCIKERTQGKESSTGKRKGTSGLLATQGGVVKEWVDHPLGSLTGRQLGGECTQVLTASAKMGTMAVTRGDEREGRVISKTGRFKLHENGPKKSSEDGTGWT